MSDHQPQERQTLDRRRAAFAYGAVGRARTHFNKPADLDGYATLVKGISAMILQNGIGQAAAFLMSKTKGAGDGPHAVLLEQIGEWLVERKIFDRPEPPTQWTEGLMLLLLKCDRSKWVRAEREAISIGMWMKRFAEALIPAKQTAPVGAEADDGG